MDRIKFIISLLIIAVFSCKNTNENVTDISAKPIKVELQNHNKTYRLLRDGQPYFIMGAGTRLDKIPILAENGANSCRTWSTEMPGYKADEFLDLAHEYGVTVMMG